MLIPQHLRGEEADFISRLRSGQTIEHFETERLHKNGTILDLSVALSPIIDKSETIVGFSKIARDISEMRRSKEALESSEQRHPLLLQGMTVGVWDWNIVTNALTWSKRFMEIIGVSAAEFVPHYDEFASRLHPEDKDRTLAMLLAHVRKEGPYDIEYRLRRTDGEYVWIHATGQAAWDESGNPLRMVGSVNDITARKHAEEQFRLVVESAPNPMLMIDQGGSIVLVNRQTEKLFGYGRDELLGQKVEMLLPERFRGHHAKHRADFYASPAILEPDVRAMAQGRDLYALCKDGSERP